MAAFLPANCSVRTLGDNETVLMGSATFAASMELKYVTVLLYVNKYTISTDRVRILVTTTNGDVQFTSAWSNLSDIGLSGVSSWWGWVRCTFAREYISALSSNSYRLYIEVGSNTAPAADSFLAVSLDGPVFTNSTTGAPCAFRVYGYR